MRRTSLIAFATLAIQPLWAATSYWDVSTNSGPQFGNGIWGTDNYWSSTLTGTTLRAWNPGDIAGFTVPNGQSGTVTLGGPQSVGGMTFAGSGSVEIAGSTMTFANNAAINVGVTAVTLSSNLVGSPNLTVANAGAGKLILSGQNDFAGIITVQANSRLQVDGSLANGGVSVGTNAWLTGNGTIGGVSSAGLIDAGNPGVVGTMTMGSLSFSPGARVGWDLADASNAQTGYDRYRVTGQLDFSGLAAGGNRLQLSLAGTPSLFDGSKNARFTLFTYGGLNLGSAQNLTDLFTVDTTSLKDQLGAPVDATRFSLYNNTTSKSIDLVYTAAVPEPSTYGLGIGLLSLGVVAVRRRRKAVG
jgi:autotransporter-associated beta strand protein